VQRSSASCVAGAAQSAGGWLKWQILCQLGGVEISQLKCILGCVISAEAVGLYSPLTSDSSMASYSANGYQYVKTLSLCLICVVAIRVA